MFLKTGFGVLIKNGKKVRKFELTPNMEHPDPIGYTWEELPSRAVLDAVVLDKSDEQIAHEQNLLLQKSLISSAKDKLRKIAGLTDGEMKALFGV